MKIFLADGSSVDVAGIGEGYLKCRTTDKLIQTIELKNVLYIPRLDGGLISVLKIIEHGFRVIFEKNDCTIYRGRQVVAKAENSGNMFRLKTIGIEVTARIAYVETCIHQWHRRLGHRDLKAIKHLSKEGIATGIKITACSKEIICEHCIKGKLAQTKFPKSKRREKEPMRLIHSDLCGPMQTATPNGNKYFLTLIDDYSRFTEVRLLKTKDEVPNVIKVYISMMLTRIGRKPIALRTDNGREYVTSELTNFL